MKNFILILLFIPALASANGVKEPSKMIHVYAKHYNSKNLKGLLSLYDAKASLVNGKGQAISGKKALHDEVKAFLGLGGKITVSNISTFKNGDLALTHNRYTLKTTDAKGAPQVIEGVTAEILKKGKNGNWYFLIDNPAVPK